MICTATYENNTILNIRTTSKTNFTMSSKSNVENKGGCIIWRQYTMWNNDVRHVTILSIKKEFKK